MCEIFGDVIIASFGEETVDLDSYPWLARKRKSHSNAKSLLDFTLKNVYQDMK